MDKKTFVRIILFCCIAILGLLVTCCIIAYSTLYHREYGKRELMYHQTIYCEGVGSVLAHIPDEYVYAGEIKRKVKQGCVVRDLDGYKCYRGDKVFVNDNDTSLIYLYSRSEEKYIPFTIPFLQQDVLRVEGELYVRNRNSVSDYVETLPAGFQFIGTVKSIIQDILPKEELQLNTSQNSFIGYEVYRSEDGGAAYLVKRLDGLFCVRTFQICHEYNQT